MKTKRRGEIGPLYAGGRGKRARKEKRGFGQERTWSQEGIGSGLTFAMLCVGGGWVVVMVSWRERGEGKRRENGEGGGKRRRKKSF